MIIGGAGIFLIFAGILWVLVKTIVGRSRRRGLHFMLPEQGQVGVADLLWGIGSLAGGYYGVKLINTMLVA